jgi:hypothetical protein
VTLPVYALLVGSLLAVQAGATEAQAPRRYLDRGDGTVEDTRSGLAWLAEAGCWDPLPWQQAKDEVGALQDGRCGLADGSRPGDWRLPTEEEWEAMVECSCGGITLTDDRGTGCHTSGSSALRGVQAGDYWSSTPSPRHAGRARVMSLHDGLSRDRDAESPRHAWPVRRGAAQPSQAPLTDGG